MELMIHHTQSSGNHYLADLPTFNYRPALWEWEYLLSILQVLEPDLEDSQVILTDDLVQLPDYGPQVIVFLHSQENFNIPQYIHRVGHVFKQYALPGQHPRLSPLPLGYGAGFLALPYRKLAQRPIDVLFCGDLNHTNRPQILNALAPQLDFCRALIRPHLNIRDYAFLHWQSKIVLCLDGQDVVETYRFYESLKLGNLILASPQPQTLAPLPYFPVNWQDSTAVVQKIQEILADLQAAEEMARAAYQAWKTHFSPEQVAAKIRLTL